MAPPIRINVHIASCVRAGAYFCRHVHMLGRQYVESVLSFVEDGAHFTHHLATLGEAGAAYEQLVFDEICLLRPERQEATQEEALGGAPAHRANGAADGR